MGPMTTGNKAFKVLAVLLAIGLAGGFVAYRQLRSGSTPAANPAAREHFSSSKSEVLLGPQNANSAGTKPANPTTEPAAIEETPQILQKRSDFIMGTKSAPMAKPKDFKSEVPAAKGAQTQPAATRPDEARQYSPKSGAIFRSKDIDSSDFVFSSEGSQEGSKKSIGTAEALFGYTTADF
jgi:hypothetical protein